MNYYFLIVFVVISQLCPAQAAQISVQNAVAAQDIAIPIAENNAAQQVKIWKQLTARNPNASENWWNYYIWTSRNTLLTSEAKQYNFAEILKEAEKNIANTATYQMLLYLQADKKDSTAIENAMLIKGTETYLYPYYILYLMEKKNDSLVEIYCKKVEATHPLKDYEFSYYKNTLNSVAKNAKLYAKGTSDLVPMVILQKVYGLRQDLQLLQYKEQVNVSSNTYLSLTLGKDVLSKYTTANYNGLSVSIYKEPSITSLKEVYETKMDFSYLDATDYLPEQAATLYKNYLPFFKILLRYYQKKEPEKAVVLENRIQKIANQTVPIPQ